MIKERRLSARRAERISASSSSALLFVCRRDVIHAVRVKSPARYAAYEQRRSRVYVVTSTGPIARR
jgi:hypothetical protein